MLILWDYPCPEHYFISLRYKCPAVRNTCPFIPTHSLDLSPSQFSHSEMPLAISYVDGAWEAGQWAWSQTCEAGHWEWKHPVLPPGDVLRLRQAPEIVQFTVGLVSLDDSYELFVPRLIKSCQGHWINIIMIRSLESGRVGTNPVWFPTSSQALCHRRHAHRQI